LNGQAVEPELYAVAQRVGEAEKTLTARLWEQVQKLDKLDP